MSDYLWDRAGAADPETLALEEKLSRYRFEPGPAPIRSGFWREHAAAIAAAVLLCAVASSLLPGIVQPRASNWSVPGGARVYIGRRIDIRSAPVALESDEIGRVELQPGADARVVESAPGRERFDLRQGRMHAFIWAPAGEFVVETPSARAVDLGCEYTLNVDPTGDGVLRVALGWVAFQVGDRESFIPAGATCATRKRGGPGIPYFEDAPDALRRGVNRFEHGDPGALPGLLAAARPHDGLTLWHLLTRVPESQRGVVFDRFRDLVQLPAGVSRDAILHRDPYAIDQCWNALDLENTSWWRGWKRTW